MYAALLWAFAVAAAPTLPIAAPAHCAVQASVEGFVGNDHALAVREHIACRHGALSDRYSLIALFDLASQQLRAQFAVGEVMRYDAHGRRVFRAPNRLAQDNPAFAHARRDWSHWAAQGNLGAHHHAFEDSLVRFAFQDGHEGAVDLHGKTIVLTGRPHQSLAADVVARLSNGEHVVIGHAASSAADRPSLEVDVYYSSSGRSVAVVTHNGGRFDIQAKRLPDGGIIGTHALGVHNRMFDFSRVLQRDFAAAHPAATGDWDNWVHSGI